MKQLYIATKIGSPILATHCKLYFAMSLMQQGQYQRASKIIRCNYQLHNVWLYMTILLLYVVQFGET